MEATPEKFQQIVDCAPIVRLRSSEPKEGYHWDVLWQTYLENDDRFRERVRAYHASFRSVYPICGV